MQHRFEPPDLSRVTDLLNRDVTAIHDIADYWRNTAWPDRPPVDEDDQSEPVWQREWRTDCELTRDIMRDGAAVIGTHGASVTFYPNVAEAHFSVRWRGFLTIDLTYARCTEIWHTNLLSASSPVA